jgi:hypothetical protein
MASMLYIFGTIFILPELILGLSLLDLTIHNPISKDDEINNYLKALFISSVTIIGIIVFYFKKNIERIYPYLKVNQIDEKNQNELKFLLIIILTFIAVFVLFTAAMSDNKLRLVIGSMTFVTGNMILITRKNNKNIGQLTLICGYVLLTTEIISFIIQGTFGVQQISSTQYLEALLISITNMISVVSLILIYDDYKKSLNREEERN